MVETVNLKETPVLAMLSLGLVLISNCRAFQASSGKGVLDITYQVNPVVGAEPSGQTAIWLEDHQGKGKEAGILTGVRARFYYP